MLLDSLLHPLYNQALPFSAWLYILLALVVAVEGPLATLAAAIASSAGFMDPWLVFLFASLGNMSADIIWYSLGYLGKIEWVVHYGGWLGIKRDAVLRLKQDVTDHVGKLLFVAKLTLGLVIPTLIAAGLARVPLRRWIGVLVSAEFVWTGSLVLVGYYYGQYILHIEKGLQWFSIGATAIVIVILAIFLIRRRPSRNDG